MDVVAHIRKLREKEKLRGKSNLSIRLGLGVAAVVCLAGMAFYFYYAYLQLSYKGVISELLAVGSLVLYIVWRCNGFLLRRKPASRDGWNFFFIGTVLFFSLLPFSIFLRSVGLAPGLIFILIFAYLWAALKKGYNLQGVLAAVLLLIFVWLWGEAGRPGIVVMPIDLPEGRTDLEFTREGLANALETALQDFSANQDPGSYHETEAYSILASELRAALRPQSPWFKGADTRPTSLEGLYASHLVVGTQVEGVPLSSIYRVLRFLRGKPLLEGQVLVGHDGSLTFALRRFNYPLNCVSDGFSHDLLERNKFLKETGPAAVQELWKTAQANRSTLRHVQDTLGCFPTVTRRILNALDILDLPSGGEERIANVTVSGLEGDAKLTAAMELAALEAMEHLSAERLALFYDNAGRYKAAESYYRKSLPELLAEAANSSPALEELARQRLANALVRIGDFQRTLDKDNHINPAYNLAAQILPNDLLVQARIGYSLLSSAREIDWYANGKCSDGAKKDVRGNLLANSIDYLNRAIAAAEGKEMKGDAIRRYGIERTTETLAWARANLLYAHFLDYQCPELKDRDSIKEDVEQFNRFWKRPGEPQPDPKERDPRAVIMYNYSRVFTDKSKASCDEAVDDLRSMGPSNRYTLHNSLLTEEQLQYVYESCNLKDEARKHETLFKSLLALIYFQRGSRQATTPLKDLLQHSDQNWSDQNLVYLGLGFLLSSKEEQKPEDVLLATDILCRFPPTLHEASQRASSLCAKIQAMNCRVSSREVTRAEQASAENPFDPYFRANLGIVRLKLGKQLEALKDFRDAMALNPKDPKLRYLLGYAVLVSRKAANSIDEAKEQMHYGALLDPNGWEEIERYFQDHSLAPCPSSGSTYQ